jgi:hypothetical protein
MNAMIDSLISLLHTIPATADDRRPLYTFQLPSSLLLRGMEADQWYGFYMLSPHMWAVMFGVVLLDLVVSVPIALMLYYGVVATVLPKWYIFGWFRYVIGYGVILFWLVVPGFCLDQIGLENCIVRFCAATIIPIPSLFRTLEAMYSDRFTTKTTAGQFIQHYCLPMRSKLVNGKTIPSTVWNKCSYLWTTVVLTLLLGCYQSVLLAVDIIPIYGKGPASTPPLLYNWHSFLHLVFVKETLVVALLLQLYLSCFANGLLFLVAVFTGTVPEPFSDRPLLCSTSPADFWGRRWNLLIHRALKDGIFRPVLSLTGSKMLGVWAVFTASGLFHEHVLRVVFHKFPSAHGTTLVFFWWHAILLLVEGYMGWPPSRLPWPLSTAITVLIGALPGHWFLDTYWRSNFFVLGQLALPMIKQVENATACAAK